MAETSTPSTTFAPSELVLLFGDRFAGPGTRTKGKEELLSGAAVVAADDLAGSVLLVALLSLEQAGLIRLEARVRKSLFGLVKRPTVFAVATGAGRIWPAGSIEPRLLAALAGGEADVSDVVYRFFGEDHPSPGTGLLTMAKVALVDRGLLERGVVTKLKILTTVTFRLPDATRELLRGESPDAALALLRAAEGRGPEFLATLRKRVSNAFARRTESGDHDFPDND